MMFSLYDECTTDKGLAAIRADYLKVRGTSMYSSSTRARPK
jgi:hypothetical protein